MSALFGREPGSHNVFDRQRESVEEMQAKAETLRKALLIEMEKVDRAME